MTTFVFRRFGGATLVRGLALACAAAVVGILGGRVAISHYGVPAVEILIAVPVLIVVIPRPFAACMLLLVLLASVPFYTWLPRANVPGHPPVNVGDVLLVATVAATLWRRPWRVWPPAVRRFYVVLGLLLLLALIPTISLASGGHADARNAIAGYKDLLFIAVSLTVALELSGKLWWSLINASIALAAIVAVLSILAAASGGVSNLLTGFDANAVTAVTAVTGTTARIRLPGLFFVYSMTIPTLVMVLLIKDRWQALRLLSLVLMVAAVAVSLNRNMYFGGAAGLLVTLLVGGARLRYRFLIVAVTIAGVLAIVVQAAVAPAVTSEVTSRAQSALSTQVLQSNSATAREDEFAHALTSIGQHPWTGVGWFQPYGSVSNDVPRLGVEDWYLDLATDLGLPVTLAFLLIPATLLVYGVRRARRAANPLDRAMIAAGVGTLVALLLSCLVGTYLQDPNSMTAFGFACGFLLAAGLRAGPARPARSPAAEVARAAGAA